MNGLRSRSANCVSKQSRVFTWLKRLKFDIILLQETHSTEVDEKYMLGRWGGLGYFSHGDTCSRGVGILIRPNSGITIDNVRKDKDGRFITLVAIYKGTSITVGNFYGPNTDNSRVIEEFCSRLDEYDNPYTVAGGDFNFCLDTSMDRETSAQRIRNNNNSRNKLTQYMYQQNLVDIWRELNPQTKQYTYIRQNPPSKSRIDFFPVNSDIVQVNNTINADIRDGYLSDHRMITISLDITTVLTGKSYWKFNNDLLKDDDFVAMVGTWKNFRNYI